MEAGAVDRRGPPRPALTLWDAVPYASRNDPLDTEPANLYNG